MIYFNNFDLLKERKQLHNTCSFYANALDKIKLKKKSFEIRQISIILTKRYLKETNTMILNNFSDITFNVAESSSNPAQILIQMQLHIKQLERKHQQQQLKTEKSDQFKKIKKKLKQ